MLSTINDVEFIDYTDESMLPDIQELVSKDLSEPYSVFTYRYFLHNWPKLCVCAYITNNNPAVTTKREMIGTLVCKADYSDIDGSYKGYIAMLAVNKDYRKMRIGSKLVFIGIDRMIEMGCDEIALEAEATNEVALNLYEKLGFIKDEKLGRYYLNGGDAFRLKLTIDRENPPQLKSGGATSSSPTSIIRTAST